MTSWYNPNHGSVDNSVYVGITGDVEKRLKEHNLGKTKSSKGKRPYELIYMEEFVNKKDARIRELKIKKSWQTKKEILDNLKS